MMTKTFFFLCYKNLCIFLTLSPSLDQGAGEGDIGLVTESLSQRYHRGASGHVTVWMQNKAALK